MTSKATRLTGAPASVGSAEIRAALSHIPADMPRDEWARMAMAVKSELAGEDGLKLFMDWSATGSAFDERAVRSTWRSVKANGGVGIGTLLHLAKQHGFIQTSAPGVREQLLRNRNPEPGAAESHAKAAAEAGRRWSAASIEGTSPYLQRKGVQAYGLRFLDGEALVPLRDQAGELCNLQRILPERSASGVDKLFLKGGRKSGLCHWCGEPASASTLLIAEGYATAASLHEATGHPVAVAFDAGNLSHVARQVRSAYPSASLVVCGDDDQATAARTGKNPGRMKAEAAARAIGARVAFPTPLAEGETDFNDLHQAQGLAVVQRCIARAQSADAGEQLQAPEDAAYLDAFQVNDGGVWHRRNDREGKSGSWDLVCSRLDVEALTRDQDGGNWGYLLKFKDPRGAVKQWAMPARMLAGDGSEYRSALLHLGLKVSAGRDTRNLLTQYIQTRQPDALAISTERIGWHDLAFVLPRETIGEGAERVVFQSDSALENTFTMRGSAALWRDRVGALCVGNSRLVFSVCCAFAGPLLRPAGIESGGFHLRGDSSSGKTTALRVAASVYGGPSYLQRWRTTDNALEVIAGQHNDCLLILDELAQVDPKTAGECAYMLANEQSKARATRTGLPRPRLTWRLLFLSAGELGLADHMAEGLKRARTGQEVRMADVPADAGAGMGAFESLHGHEGAAGFARHISGQAASVYGVAGRAWLEWLTANASTLKARVREAAAAIGAQVVPAGAGGQVERVGARFALVAAAGELATAAGLTGWEAGEATRGARACFNSWLQARGGIGNGETVAILRQVRHFLEVHGEGRFTWWSRAGDDHSAKTLQRAGFRRQSASQGHPEIGTDGPVEFFVLAEIFRKEICQGFDYQVVARVLRDHECLITDKERLDIKTRLPGLGQARCYRIVPRIFELDL